MLWSSIPSELPLTIVTTVTPSRLDALEAQCGSWAGPLAAAVYVPLATVLPVSLTKEAAAAAVRQAGSTERKGRSESETAADEQLTGSEAIRIEEVGKALQDLFDRQGRWNLTMGRPVCVCVGLNLKEGAAWDCYSCAIRLPHVALCITGPKSGRHRTQATAAVCACCCCTSGCRLQLSRDGGRRMLPPPLQQWQ